MKISNPRPCTDFVNHEEKVMKNLRSDHEVEIKCAQFFKALEHKVVKLESEIKNKVDEAKVKEMIQEE